MASGCCGSSSSGSTLIRGGDGIKVEGSGTSSNPYLIISDLPDFSSSIRVRDTTTVNMTITGSGTTSDPFELRADSTLKLSQLKDVADPQGGPAEGESIFWTGSGGAGHWEFGTLPPAPAGAVNVSDGLSGLGSAGDPLKVRVSGVWGEGDLAGKGSDTTVGLTTYIDAEGNLRAEPLGSISWASITDKPTTFKPSQHTHNAADISSTEQLKLNVGKVNGRRFTATANSSTPPTETSAYDVWFFPKGT